MANVNINVPILVGSNFNNWKFRINAILEKEQLLSVVTNEPPTDETKKKDFLINDSKAKAVIVQGLSDKHLDIIKDAKTSKAMFKSLQDIFVRSSSFSKLTLWRKLVTLKCDNCDKLEDHFLKFDSLTRELEDHGSKIDEGDKICHLLLSLPKNYETVITALETHDSLKMDLVRSRLLDEEAKFRSNKPSKTSSNETEVSFKSQSGCFNCGDNDHFIANCPKAGNGRFSNSLGQSRGQYSRGRSGRRFSRGNRHPNNSRSNFSSRPKSVNAHLSDVSFVALRGNKAVGLESGDKNVFILDSGASNHLVSEELENSMFNIEAVPNGISIHIANGDIMTAYKRGKIRVKCQDRVISIDALIVPGLKHNLLALNKLADKGYQIVINKTNMTIKSADSSFICCFMNGLYILKCEILPNDQCFATVKVDDIWHRRLGHLNKKSLIELGLPYSSEKCSTCIEGKGTRLPFLKHVKTSKHIGELIHSDLCGPINPPTHNGEKYFQVIIDDFSNFVVVNLLKRKSEAEEYLVAYIKDIETQHQTKVKSLRLDNGGEVTSNEFKHYVRSKGIRLQYTMPYSPQSNGKSERMNRSLINKVRTKLIDAGVPKDLWGEALRCSAYELNRSPTFSLEKGMTPAVLWHGKQDLSKLKIFGCQSWFTCIPKGAKLDPRAKTSVMIGYCNGGYRLWLPDERKIVQSRDVVFNENKMYFLGSESTIQQSSPSNQRIEEESKPEIPDEDECDRDKEDSMKIRPIKSPKIDVSATNRPLRTVKKPSYLDDFEVYNAFCLMSNFNEDPEFYEDAIADKEWKKAIESELESHSTLGTWEPAELSANQKAIDLKWIFKTKDDGTKKARLVAKGFQQPITGDEFTYSPVCRMSTLRILLSQATTNDWKTKQIDVPTAFLNGILEDEVYIKRPQGVESNEKFFKLKRALYGLRSSPKCWNNRFSEFLLKQGLKRSQYDYCLYSAKEIYLLLFVDDALLTGNVSKVNTLISNLQNEFNVKDLGEAKCFLGIEITRSENGMQLNQTKMIDKLLTTYRMDNCHTKDTPMETGFQIPVQEYETSLNVPYRSLVCSLLYLAITTRPDIAFSVSLLSRVLDKPSELTWKSAKRVLRYLSGTREIGLQYYKNGQGLQGFADADWGGDVETRKSTSGFLAVYNGNAVSWFSKKQSCVALSTMEAEYYAASAGAQELVSVKGIVSELVQCKSDLSPVYLMVDNLSAVSLVKTYQNSKRAKHIDIRAHFIKDLCQKGIIDVKHVSSNKNLADLFTKALCKEKFVQLRNEVMNIKY